MENTIELDAMSDKYKEYDRAFRMGEITEQGYIVSIDLSSPCKDKVIAIIKFLEQ